MKDALFGGPSCLLPAFSTVIKPPTKETCGTARRLSSMSSSSPCHMKRHEKERQAGSDSANGKDSPATAQEQPPPDENNGDGQQPTSMSTYNLVGQTL
ncbi:UNVERIFIED_CONTAM: hypothetical protein K2H54_048688 [Gekko kuhli]